MLKIVSATAEKVNLVFYQNAVPIVRERRHRQKLPSIDLPSRPSSCRGVWQIEKIADQDFRSN